MYAGLEELRKDLFIPSFSCRRPVGSVKIGNAQDVSVAYGRMRDGSPQPITTSWAGPNGKAERVSGVMCGGRERI